MEVKKTRYLNHQEDNGADFILEMRIEDLRSSKTLGKTFFFFVVWKDHIRCNLTKQKSVQSSREARQ